MREKMAKPDIERPPRAKTVAIMLAMPSPGPVAHAG